MADYDVIVVGAGNAALSAAISAREQGAARVLVLEKADQPVRGGNTHYSGGLFRFAFERPEDLRPLVPDAEREFPGFFQDVPPYTYDQFMGDLLRVTEGRTDPELSKILVGKSYETVCWVREQGVEMEPALTLGGVQMGDKITWVSGAIIRAVHEGVGLSKMWFDIARKRGVEIRYRTRAHKLLQDASGRVTGVTVQGPEGYADLAAGAVILGCGGFESNPQWRARYLGRPWDMAKVRGTAYNTGDGLRMAFDVGAVPFGQWTGCHSTPIDASAPPFGDRELTDKTNRLTFPQSIMLNNRGQRFADEGEDFTLYTYAKMGTIILNQPGGVAYQLFDEGTRPLLEPRYQTGTPVVADTLEDLVRKLPIDVQQGLDTVAQYQEAAGREGWDPMRKDGLRTKGLSPDKTNWARKLEKPPFYAYPVTGGITFTFGGVHVTEKAEILSVAYAPIPGLFACGEMVGGLFAYNYPGGSGLMSGAVFGRIAGASAAHA